MIPAMAIFIMAGRRPTVTKLGQTSRFRVAARGQAEIMSDSRFALCLLLGELKHTSKPGTLLTKLFFLVVF